MSEDLARRARLHAALGEPTRLAIVDELAASDRSPHELGQRLGLATNLLAHHLDVLDAAGLITRIASTGDRRRRYIGLRRGPLAELGVIAPRSVDRRMLFVCSHNSARSQLAAAMWTARTGEAASSAGTHPADRVHPSAVAAARRAGLDLEGAVPRRLEPDDIDDDLVVTVCDRVHEELDAGQTWLHWSIPDPVEVGTTTAFDTTIADLDERINALTT